MLLEGSTLRSLYFYDLSPIPTLLQSCPVLGSVGNPKENGLLLHL